MIRSRLFNQTEIEFIKNNAKGNNDAALTKLFNEEFKREVKVTQISSFRRNHGFPSGIDMKFKKGEVNYKPPKGTRNSIETEFKKGNKPANTLPIGTKLKRTDGYWRMKVSESPGPGLSRKSWKLIHHLIWEEKHGPIKKGHRVIFLDQNQDNLVIENLMSITSSLAAIMSKNDLFTNDIELTKTNINIAKLIQAASKRKREKKK